MVTQDVDLWFEDLSDPKLGRALQAVGAAYAPPFGPNPPMLAGSHTHPFDIVVSMSGLGRYAEEVEHAKEIRLGRLRLKVLSLERIIVSKIAANRPKDRLVIPVLRNTLCTLRVKAPGTGRARRPRRHTQKPKRGNP